MPKVTPKNYAQAFMSYLDSLDSKDGKGSGHDKAIAGLMGTLASRGDMAKRGQVLREVEKLVVAREGGRLVEAELAHALGISDRAKFMASFKKSDRVVTSVNSGLVAGVRILFNGEEELDASLAGRLTKVFKD